MKFHADSNSVKKPSYVSSGILPCVRITSSKKDVHGNKCHFRHVEAEGKPDKKLKGGGAEGSVAILKESIQLGCVSQDSYPRKSIQREPGILGSKHAVKFSKGTWHHINFRERKGPSQGIIEKCEPHERGPCAPQFEDRSLERDLAPRKMRPKRSMRRGEKCLQAQELGQNYALFFY